MQKPDKELEQQFNKDGVFFLEEKSINQFKGKFVGLDIEIVIMGDVSLPDFSVSAVNRRGVATMFTDWGLIEREGQKILRLSAWQQTPLDRQDVKLDTRHMMSFLDLCFYAGNEAIPEVYGEDIETKKDPNAVPFDLGWILSSRQVDAFINAAGKLDTLILAGNMQQALLYGPCFIDNQE